MDLSETPNKSRVSAVIVNWNGKRHLDECLGSLARQSYPDLEIIMVDNASSDGSVEFVRENFPQVTVIENETNTGFSGGNNIGIARSTGKYLFLLNNDTVVDEGCISELVRVIEEKGESCIGVFPKVNFHDEPMFINSYGAVWNWKYYWRDNRMGLLDLGQYREPQEVFGSIFPALLVKRDAFLNIGMFDEYFFSYGEDFDICYRANLMGYKFFLSPGARVLHKFRASSGEKNDPMWSHYYFLRNYIIVFLKNYQLFNLLTHLPKIIWRYLISQVIIAVKYKNKGGVKLVFKVARDIFLELPDILQKRKWIQARRRKPDKEIWDYSSVEDCNIFYYNNAIVLNVLNLKTSIEGSQKYKVNNTIFTTMG